MSTRPTKKTAQPPVTADAVSRLPQQGRSKASLERMLAAAHQLMIERGTEDFTLQEVSQRGNVSIGSIYLRFESKDNLVRAVLATSMTEIGEAEESMLAEVRKKAANLEAFIPRYVEAYAEMLRLNAPLLRLSMTRAEHDPLVSEPGKRLALKAQKASADAMLAYSHEFGGSDHEIKANAAFLIIFSVLARQLSLGSSAESAHDYDWELQKRELGKMALAYLKSDS